MNKYLECHLFENIRKSRQKKSWLYAGKLLISWNFWECSKIQILVDPCFHMGMLSLKNKFVHKKSSFKREPVFKKCFYVKKNIVPIIPCKISNWILYDKKKMEYKIKSRLVFMVKFIFFKCVLNLFTQRSVRKIGAVYLT